MSYIPTVDQARELVAEFNKEPFHLQAMPKPFPRSWASLQRNLTPSASITGPPSACFTILILSFTPEQHCVKAQELLRDKDIDESVIHAVISHGCGICIDVEPELFMEKVLFAADELPALSVPSRSCARPAYPIWR